MKKTLIFALCVFSLLFTLVIFGASAAVNEGTPVSNAAEFEAMVSGGTYYLTNDIDLGGKDYENGIFGRRVDSDADGKPDKAVGFSVTLYGNGHTVGNFVLGDVEGYHVGMFTEVMSGQYLNIYDLNVGSATLPVSVTRAKTASYSYGVMAGHVAEGSANYLKNVNVTATFKVDTNTKGMFGMFTGKTRCFVFENCTSNGTLELGDGAAHSNYFNAAGFCGSVEASVSFFNCTNNTNITIKGTKTEGRAAGFVGYCNAVVYLENCINNGNMTVLDGNDYTSDAYVAGFLSDVTRGAVFVNCKNNGTLTCTKTDRIGELVTKSRKSFVAVGSSHNDAIADCPIFSDSTKKTAVIVDSLPMKQEDVPANSKAIATKEDFLNITSGGVYHLTADIDFGGQVFTDYILKEFSGVLNGCGHKIYNYTITGTTSTAQDVGTIATVGSKGGTIICNLIVGEANNPVQLINLSDSSPASAQSKGLFIGVVNDQSAIYIKNVDVYGEVKANTTDKINIGGFITYIRDIVLDDCTFTGSMTNVTGPDHLSPNYYANMGVFGANVANNGVYFLNCVSDATVIVGAIDGSESVRASGFFAWATKFVTMIGCENKSTTTTLNATLDNGTVTKGGLSVGFAGAASQGIIMIDCVNSGTINGKDIVAGFIGNLGGAALLLDCENKGTVATDATTSGNFAGVGAEKVFAFTLPKAETPVVPTPPTSDMSIVYVACVAMVALATSTVIVFRKRRSLSK